MYDNQAGIYQDVYYYTTTDRLVLVVDPVVYTAREYYLYDQVGNRTLSLKGGAFISYQHNLANQLTAAGQVTFTYDNNGNMLTKADTGASSNITYTYDYENRLVRADRNASGNTTTSSYYYDPFGRRIVKTVYENSAFSRFAWYVYDREDILVENRNDSRSGYSTGRFFNIHGPDIDEPVAYTNNGQMYFYHADGLGSVRIITDSAGSVTRRYSYDAYGNITASIIDRPYTYTGREYDDETGLYYYRNRYYDPKIGRFISKDPIGFAGGDVNLYNYVGGNPVNWVDPWGLLECQIGPDIPKNPFISQDANKFKILPNIPGKLKVEPDIDPPQIDYKNLLQNPQEEIDKLKNPSNWNWGIYLKYEYQF